MKTDKEKQELKGPVKSVQVEYLENIVQEDGQTIEKPLYSSTTYFNRDGWMIEQLHQNPDGSKFRNLYDYSDTGKLQSMRSFDSSDSLVGEVKYIYDDKGRLTTEQYIDQGGKITTPTTYIYDTEDKKTKIQNLDFIEEAGMIFSIEGTNGSILFTTDRISRVETSYDNQGEAVEVKFFKNEGELVGRAEITRDSWGNPLEETLYYGDIVERTPHSPESPEAKKLAAITEEQKLKIEEETARMFSPGSVMSKNIHKYDEAVRLIETKQTMKGMVPRHQTFTYDEAGNKSEQLHYYGNGLLESKTIFSRDLDGYGNWTKEIASTVTGSNVKTDYTNPVSITRRTITYYE